MYMSDVIKQEEIRTIANDDLRKLGIKCRLKKSKTNIKISKNGRKVFKTSLNQLQTQIVTLRTGHQIIVPKIVHELCSFILTKIDTVGLFRKEGSRARQNEIKIVLDSGCQLNEEHHVIDVAVILKTFLRELPEPLVPYSFHELFLRCILLKKSRLDALLLACLQLPVEHLNTLSYLMQFFSEIAESASANKMDAYNLAVVVGPTAFPIDDKISPNPHFRVTKICEIFKLLIENSTNIGMLPEDIIERIGNTSSNDNSTEKHKKKRRSGSLTRNYMFVGMFNGLKKIVVGKNGNEISTTNVVTPDLLMTPINRSIKKRKIENGGFSNKKRKDLISHLPDGALLNVPFTPVRTPINKNPGTNMNGDEIRLQSTEMNGKEKKFQWYNRSKSLKTLNGDEGKSTSIERRWSIFAPSEKKRLKKRTSYCGSPQLPEFVQNNIDYSSSGKAGDNGLNEPDYVRISKTEYEEIKNRVSAIERRISIELDTVSHGFESENSDSSQQLQNVQAAFNEMMGKAAATLSPSTDHLARRLSRELKIRRRCSETKIIRSPSARKIGSMRRRSKEFQAKPRRYSSWHVKSNNPNDSPSRISSSSTTDLNSKWTSAEGVFSTENFTNSSDTSDRASLTELRAQNAGMVLAKAKLFDNLLYSDVKPIPRVKLNTNRIGGARNEIRTSHRVRTLRNEERRVKKSMSPKKKVGPIPASRTSHGKTNPKFDGQEKTENKENRSENIPENLLEKSPGTPLKDCNRIDLQDMKMQSARFTPQIKRPLIVKTPSHLNKISHQKCTPLKALAHI